VPVLIGSERMLEADALLGSLPVSRILVAGRNPAGGFMFVKKRTGFQDPQYHVAHDRIIVSNILNLPRAFRE
jgi:hypothetical protein